MGWLPPSTNADYRGHPLAIWLTALFVVLTLVPALIHMLLPDGGANVIAGLGIDLTSDHGRLVVSLFAWAGTTQFVWGLTKLAVVLRYRSLLPLILGLITLERVLHAWHMWGPKGGEHHPPEAYVTLVMIPALALVFWLSQPRRSQ